MMPMAQMYLPILSTPLTPRPGPLPVNGARESNAVRSFARRVLPSFLLPLPQGRSGAGLLLPLPPRRERAGVRVGSAALPSISPVH